MNKTKFSANDYLLSMNESLVPMPEPNVCTTSTAGKILRYSGGNTAVQTPEYSGTAHPHQP